MREPGSFQMADIDPKLQTKIKQAGDKGTVEAVVMLSDDAAQALERSAEKPPPNYLIEQVSTLLDEKPAEVRYLPKLGVLTVRASGRFVEQLLKLPGVTVATVPEADVTKAQVVPRKHRVRAPTRKSHRKSRRPR